MKSKFKSLFEQVYNPANESSEDFSMSTNDSTENNSLTISDLIDQLKQIKAEHGDLPVLVINDNSIEAATDTRVSEYISGFRKKSTGVLIQ